MKIRDILASANIDLSEKIDEKKLKYSNSAACQAYRSHSKTVAQVSDEMGEIEKMMGSLDKFEGQAPNKSLDDVRKQLGKVYNNRESELYDLVRDMQDFNSRLNCMRSPWGR